MIVPQLSRQPPTYKIKTLVDLHSLFVLFGRRNPPFPTCLGLESMLVFHSQKPFFNLAQFSTKVVLSNLTLVGKTYSLTF